MTDADLSPVPTHIPADGRPRQHGDEAGNADPRHPGDPEDGLEGDPDIMEGEKGEGI